MDSNLLEEMNTLDLTDNAQEASLIEKTTVPSDSEPKPVCRLFRRGGKCRFGDKCLYSHQPQRRADSSNKQPEVPKSNQTMCRFFQRSGYCSYGDNCKFLHRENSEQPTNSERSKGFPRKIPVCRYFKRSTCREGENCAFRHPVQSALTNTVDPSEGDKVLEPVTNSDLKSSGFNPILSVPSAGQEKSEHEASKPCSTPRNVFINPLTRKFNINELTDDSIKSLCNSEIAQLKKRFPRYTQVEVRKFRVNFTASDPDWPFDVKSLELLIYFPANYPKEVCTIECCDETNGLPLILFRHLNRSMESWLLERQNLNTNFGVCELFLRHFLRWMDRNLQDLFIIGLRMAKKNMEAESQGIVFIPHEDLADDVKNMMGDLGDDPIDQTGSAKDVQPIKQTKKDPEDITTLEPKLEIANSTKKIGTEIKLCNVELSENAATLSCQKLSLLLQCGRCKMRCDISLAPHRTNRVVCAKCRHEQKVTFRPQLIHQFLAVLGYLDVLDCHAVDVPLPKCQFAVGCLNCNRQMALEGLQFGQRRTTWCLFCNQKMLISIQSVKFNRLQAGSGQRDSSGQLIQLGKSKKKVNDPGIQEGSPLPDNGTCKHYKKSYRWLRFPCCGKAYPCDVCHEEKESDHEMKLATRMICGYCAKEQPYASSKECILCGNNMTKKAGGHWQGGKGCRDNVKMNRLDRQKYSGVSKTVSTRSQRKAT